MDMIRIFGAVVLIVAAGLVQGAWTNRWGPSPALAALGTEFEAVSMVIGDWKGTAYELPARERAMAGAVACLARRYSNPSRGVTVTVLLLGGLPGDIAAHTSPTSATRVPVTPWTPCLDSNAPTALTDIRRNSERAWQRGEGQVRPSCGLSGVGTLRMGGRRRKTPADNLWLHRHLQALRRPGDRRRCSRSRTRPLQ